MHEELEQLITRRLDGVADATETRRLEDALRDSAEAREQYVHACEIRQALSEEFSPQLVGLPTRRSTRLRSAFLGAAAVAAAVALVMLRLPSRGAPAVTEVAANPGDEKPSPGALSEPFARVVQKINCVWSDDSWSPESSGVIEPGQTIALERGFMKLRLRNGVSVVLEGPVAFTFDGELRGSLDYGGAGVRVPDGFKGYVVNTPSARLVDMGTEFAVRVLENGSTDLRVVDGEVEASPRGRRGRAVEGRSVLLKKDAVWNSVTGISRPNGPPEPGDFPTASLLEDPDFQERPDLNFSDRPLLWLAADTAVRTDAEGGVVAWGDISSSSSADRHSAWQVEPHRRPKLLDSGIGGLPAISFDGEDDCLITEPFATGDAQTIAMVCRFNRFRDRHRPVRAHQIINYNGPPQLVIDYRLRERSLRAQAYAGVGKTPERSGRIHYREVAPGDTLLIVYAYDHPANRAALYVNGEPQGQSRASFSVASNRPKVIGIHRRLEEGGFDGVLSELIIYDRALTPDEVGELFAYFERRLSSSLGVPTSAAVSDTDRSSRESVP